jgi:hypothetical protein
VSEMTTELLEQLMQRGLDDAVVFRQSHDRATYSITFPYDPRIVAAIKAIPSRYRAYAPETKTWTVTRGFANALMGNLREHGCWVEVIEG